MKKEFVRTENHRRFETAVKLREQRGAAESGLIVVHGRAGEGKTRTLHNWASARRAVMVTGYPGITPRRVMLDIAERLHISPRGQWEKAVEEAIAAEELPLVVDESGFALAEGAATIERLRTITDKSGTLLVLALMQPDMARLRRHDQITSRATLCEFLPSGVEDVEAACAQLSELQISAELARRIHSESEGRMRLVVNAIQMVEHMATAGHKTTMGLEDIQGMRLCQDFPSVTAAARRGR